MGKTSENVRPKRPLGIYVFTLIYAALSAFVLIATLSLLPTANATMYYVNPWDTQQGPVTAITSLTVLVSSIAAFRGSRIGRACLTASVLASLLGLFALNMWLAAELLEMPGCSGNVACMVRDGWQLGPPTFWVTLALFFAFHCWYFFGPRTRQFYSACTSRAEVVAHPWWKFW